MLYIQQVMIKSIRGENEVIGNEIIALIDKFKASAYLQQSYPIKYRTARKEL